MASGPRKQRSKLPAELLVSRLAGGDERRLHFAHLNGQRPENSSPVGGLVQAEYARRCAAGPAWRRRVVAVIEEHAGPALLARVDGIELRRGILRLEVAEGAARYELGLRWQQRLLAILRAHLPSAGISGVRFVTRSSPYRESFGNT